MEERECCCMGKTKARTEEEYKSLIHRLSRIEGQIVEQGNHHELLEKRGKYYQLYTLQFEKERLRNA